ncbi:unnamed protein product [Darwinula stevensoni]|uniref:Uncharacterized protein n=1 Tax=Darwinula stevensoni TaxID=69355 RepID=A0A7R9A1P8_9CRUS|nr:unnamed protein product [Darwinula stevensoni]CAG0887083.1 unnamed protein product [Darwinula stevensoni]
MVGLLLIAMGTGGIKPCVSAFGGDQFVIPGQEKQLGQFFSAFYFAINGGSLISTFLTPILREDVHCFGDKSCFPLAFGVPAALMITSLMIFLLGKPLYKIVPPKGNVLIQVLGCVKHALGRRWKSGKEMKKKHWLDYADDKFDKKLIRHTKILMGVLFLYIPLPVFWALFDQQGSRWTLQATRMNGKIGSFTVKPDQLQVINPLLVLILIPLFQFGVYPALAKFGLLTKSIPRMFVGGILAGVAFAVSGLVELQLEKTYPKYPSSDQVRIQMINGLNCNLQIKSNGGLMNMDDSPIPPFGIIIFDNIPTDRDLEHDFNASNCTRGAFVPENQFQWSSSLPDSTQLNLGGKVVTFLVSVVMNNTRALTVTRMQDDDIEKGEGGFPKVRVLFNTPDAFWNNTIVKFKAEDEMGLKLVDGPIGATEYGEAELDESTVCIEEFSKPCVDVKKFKGEFGATYNVLIQRDEKENKIDLWQYEVTSPNSMSMFLQIPQYVIITIGEIMYSITGLEFSYQQAPKSMKSVVTSAWLLTNTFGNLIDVFIVAVKFFDSQAYEFFLFAAIMGVAMAAFATMGYYYQSVDNPDADDDEEEKSREMLEKEKMAYQNKALDDD